ncbi:long-chain-fatty-acid--CoA ligase [Deinococcus aquiradiocola]|uniref:Long-chain-fatty-acid--CoA ligase n=1 Tax=Deinococcus aquiradiocola TaxID=393059 RepID=A0A917PN77_9DEIO|nr:long-chain fatty acid--CoA ligase [Deinococcus aquiradiocola]GGJ85042.1 long-chain-fatty-acid--CoA ligase [Deinococcus aquiradiocola]
MDTHTPHTGPQETARPWLSHYQNGVPADPTLDIGNLPAMLERTALRFPDRTALHFMGQKCTYRQLWQDVRRFAAALQQQGVQPGDRVSIMLPNCPQFVVAFYGASLAGAVVVNTSPLYVAPELTHQLLDSGSETLVILDSFYPRFEADRVPGVKRVIVTGVQDALPFPKNLLYPLRERMQGHAATPPSGERVHQMQALIHAQPTGVQPRTVPLAPDTLALLQYTGGTTGTPKGAMLTHGNLIANTVQASAWMPDLQMGQEVLLAAIPFFHVYGMTTAMNMGVLIGATVVLVPNPRDIKMLLTLVQSMKPTLFPGVPTMYGAINAHPDTPRYDLTSIRACISGSAPLPHETARRFREITRGANLVEGYGLTEASPVTHCNPVTGEQQLGSIGLPVPGVYAYVAAPDGTPLPNGEAGELYVSGPNVMAGYWQRDEESRATLPVRAGRTWLRTGDVAVMSDDGFFRIVDRQKDVIIAGGFNIYPREVEEVLYAHPAVQEAAAIGVPHPHRGETVKVFVVFRPGMQASQNELESWCRERLSPYKVPKLYEVRSELPKSAVGKVLRRALADQERAAPKAAG